MNDFVVGYLIRLDYQEDKDPWTGESYAVIFAINVFIDMLKPHYYPRLTLWYIGC
jgi:hypothetical protein